jgi:hypothetical protein
VDISFVFVQIIGNDLGKGVRQLRTAATRCLRDAAACEDAAGVSDNLRQLGRLTWVGLVGQRMMQTAGMSSMDSLDLPELPECSVSML